MHLEWDIRGVFSLLWQELTGLLASPRDRMREACRRKQEREFRLSEIDEEEEYILLHSPPKPRNPASRWMAVRLGKVVAEGMERTDVEQAVYRIQKYRPYYSPIIVEVGVPLPTLPFTCRGRSLCGQLTKEEP